MAELSDEDLIAVARATPMHADACRFIPVAWLRASIAADRALNAAEQDEFATSYFGADADYLAAKARQAAPAQAAAEPARQVQTHIDQIESAEPMTEAEAWDHREWRVQLMTLVDEHWATSLAARTRTRQAIYEHASLTGPQWRAAAFLRKREAAPVAQAERAVRCGTMTIHPKHGGQQSMTHDIDWDGIEAGKYSLFAAPTPDQKG